MVYTRNGVLYAPSTAKTDAGFERQVEPVGVAPLADREMTRRIVVDTIRRGNPRVPTPNRTDYASFLFSGYVPNCRSWAAFQKSADAWLISEKSGRFGFSRLVRSKGGWSGGGGSPSFGPEGESLEDFAVRLLLSIEAELARVS